MGRGPGAPLPRPGGRAGRAGGPGSPRTPGRSPRPRPAAARQSVPRAPGHGAQPRPPDCGPRRPAWLLSDAFVCPVSSPRPVSAPTPRNPGPEDAPRREPRTRGQKGCLPGWGAMLRPSEAANRLGPLDQGQEVCSPSLG